MAELQLTLYRLLRRFNDSQPPRRTRFAELERASLAYRFQSVAAAAIVAMIDLGRSSHNGLNLMPDQFGSESPQVHDALLLACSTKGFV